MKSTDYSRPGGFARWGWLGVAVNVIGALANVAMLTLANGGLMNWLAIAICTASGIYCWTIWRDAVRAVADHRAYMQRFASRWDSL